MARKINFESMSVDGVRNMRKEVEDFLAHLEDEHRNAGISDEAYNEAKEKNEKKLKEITDTLTNWGVLDSPTETAEAAKAEPAPVAKPESVEQKNAKQAPDARIEPAVVQANRQQPQSTYQEPAAAAAAANAAMQAELIQTKMNAEVEKLKAFIDAVKETGASMDERMQKTTESIGELRSMVFQREGAARETELKIEKIEDEMSAIKPEKITKELEKRDRKSAEQDMILERLDRKSSDTQKIITGIRETLESIGGLENIAGVNKNVAEKLAKFGRAESEMQKLSSKIEKMYIDINKKLEEFTLYKTRQDSMGELLEDLMKSVDTITVNLDSYSAKSDFEKFKGDVLALQESMGRIRTSLDAVIPLVQLKLPDSIKSLREEKEGIETLLSSIADEVKKGRVPRSEYEKAKARNMKRLSEIDEKLKKEWDGFLQALKIKQPQAAETKTPESRPAEAAKQEPKEKTEAKAAEEETVVQENEDKPAEEDEVAEKMQEKKPQEKSAVKKEESEAAVEPDETGPESTDGKKKSSKSMEAETRKAEKPELTEDSGKTEKDRLLEELDDSFRKGMISKEAYERTKKVLEGYEE